jgi:hypothetical protein
VSSSKLPPLVTPTSFDICSLISGEVHEIGPLTGLDAKTLPDPVSVEALRAALAEAVERNAPARAPVPGALRSKASPVPAAPAVVASTPAPRRGSRWAMYGLALGAAFLMATMRLAVEPLAGAAEASPPRETGPSEATMVVTPPDLPPAPAAAPIVRAPIVTAPVVIAAVKEKPAAFSVRRPTAQTPSAPAAAATAPPPFPATALAASDESSTRAGKELATSLVPKGPTMQPAAHAAAKGAARGDDSELAAAARLERLAAQQVGTSLGR